MPDRFDPTASAHPNRDSYRRVLRGAAWLGSGQVLSDLCTILYLFVLSRTLGADFGQFVLIVTIGQMAAHLFGFQSWRVIVRFGGANAARSLGALCRWVAVRDLSVALAGAALAAFCVWNFTQVIGVAPALRWPATLFSLTIILMQRGIPCGILRLKRCFAINAGVDAVLPLGRLLVALLLLSFGGRLEYALVGWALAETVTTLALWVAALNTRDRLVADTRAAPTASELNRFYWRSSISEALRLSSPEIPLVAIAIAGGGAILGDYRLAMSVAKLVCKPIMSLSVSFYVEASSQESAKNDLGRQKLFQSVVQTVLALTIALLALFWLSSPELMQTFDATLTTSIWLSMIVAATATCLEVKLLVQSAPLIVPVSRALSLVVSFLTAWTLAPYNASTAGVAATLTAGMVHIIGLAAWTQHNRHPFAPTRSPLPSFLLRSVKHG